MNKPIPKLASSVELELHEGTPASPFDKIRGFLTAYNKEKLGFDRKTALITANSEGNIVGGISFRWYGRSAFIDFLAVEKIHQKQGIGGQLVNATEKELIQQGCQQVCVFTEEFQAPNFYKSQGYTLIETTPNYNNGYARLTFRKILTEGETI